MKIQIFSPLVDATFIIKTGLIGYGTVMQFILQDSVFWRAELWDLFGGIDSSYTYLNSKFTEKQLSDLYTNYYPRNTYSLENYSPKQELNGIKLWISGGKSAVFRLVPRSVRILDIGCGFGESLGYHLARGCEVFGSEVDRNIKRVADKFGYNVQVGMFDPNNYESDFFDYVAMAQVIEHFTDPILILRGVSKLLKNNGRVVLSTPNSKDGEVNFLGEDGLTGTYHIISNSFPLNLLKLPQKNQV